jgi:hypothetical protein
MISPQRRREGEKLDQALRGNDVSLRCALAVLLAALKRTQEPGY